MDALADATSWRPDGDGPLTMYARVAVDVPGLYVADVHFHGQHRKVVQVVVTGTEGCGGIPGPGSQAYQELVDVGLPVVLVRRKHGRGWWHYDLEGPPKQQRLPGP